ncbi:hypothetical protein, partial [Hyella patelloides]|uniref:hypothetical protein n=1 Tax=Hyella patelloides TaxID=1982969 RepID=UPI001C94E54D
VGIGARFKCLRICNSTSIALSTSQLLNISSIVVQISESDRRGINQQSQNILLLFAMKFVIPEWCYNFFNSR